MSIPPCDVDQGLASDAARTQWRELRQSGKSQQVTTQTQQLVAEQFGLSAEEQRRLSTALPGHGLLLVGPWRTHLHVIASRAEERVAMTAPRERQRWSRRLLRAVAPLAELRGTVSRPRRGGLRPGQLMGIVLSSAADFGTGVADPPHPVGRIVGVPANVFWAAVTTASACAGWLLDAHMRSTSKHSRRPR